jgi:hypothetical protein
MPQHEFGKIVRGKRVNAHHAFEFRRIGLCEGMTAAGNARVMDENPDRTEVACNRFDPGDILIPALDGRPTEASLLASPSSRWCSAGSALTTGVFRPVDKEMFYFSLIGACDLFFFASATRRRVFGDMEVTDELKRRYITHITDVYMSALLISPEQRDAASPKKHVVG